MTKAKIGACFIAKTKTKTSWRQQTAKSSWRQQKSSWRQQKARDVSKKSSWRRLSPQSVPREGIDSSIGLRSAEFQRLVSFFVQWQEVRQSDIDFFDAQCLWACSSHEQKAIFLQDGIRQRDERTLTKSAPSWQTTALTNSERDHTQLAVLVTCHKYWNKMRYSKKNI